MRASWWANILVLVAVIVALPAIAIIIMGVFEPDPVAYPEQPFQVVTPEVERGSGVVVSYERCVSDPFVKLPLVYSFAVELVGDGNGVRQAFQSSVITARQLGCERVTFTSNPLPANVGAGYYHFEGTTVAFGRFRLSPVILQWSTDTFRLIERRDPD